ncbi:MAG: hypothetical protein AAGF15_02170 [Pseudomonadota bacterium]
MSEFTKDPAARVDFAVDFAAYLAPNETIVGMPIWSVIPDGELTLDAPALSEAKARIFADGGIVGHRYRVSVRISTSQGRIDERQFDIKIVDH